MALKFGRRRSSMAAVALIVVAVCGLFWGCGTSNVETGRTFDSSTFSESDARETLGVAVREECLKSNLGVSGLVGPLRRVETATATKALANWNFQSDGKVATVSPAGRVSGDLLRDLTSEC